MSMVCCTAKPIVLVLSVLVVCSLGGKSNYECAQDYRDYLQNVTIWFQKAAPVSQRESVSYNA